MPNMPPETGPSAFIAFAVVNELLRTLVAKGTLEPADAAALLERAVDSVRGPIRHAADEAITVMQEMRSEYQGR